MIFKKETLNNKKIKSCKNTQQTKNRAEIHYIYKKLIANIIFNVSS